MLSSLVRPYRGASINRISISAFVSFADDMQNSTATPSPPPLLQRLAARFATTISPSSHRSVLRGAQPLDTPVSWVCPSCTLVNGLELSVCDVCGAAAVPAGSTEREQSPPRSRAVINLVSSDDESASDGVGLPDDEPLGNGVHLTDDEPVGDGDDLTDDDPVGDVDDLADDETLRKADQPTKSSQWSVYLLQNTSERNTYIGATVNLKRRLRQHNGDIAGGAKATRGKGPWRFVATISGFQTQKQALQFEWRAKKKVKADGRKLVVCVGIRNRILNLIDVLRLDKWTKSAPMATEVPLVLRWHDEGASDLAHDSGPALPCYITHKMGFDE